MSAAVLLAKLIRTIPSPVFCKDMSGRYLGCSNVFETFCGVKRGALIGKTPYELWPKDLADAYAATRGSPGAKQDVQRQEVIIQSADGVRHDVLVHQAVFFDFSGAPAGVIGALVDVTEHKHAERSLLLFRNLIDRSNDAIEVVDPETYRFIDANIKAFQDLGYSREEFLSMHVRDIDPLFDRAMGERIEAQLRESGSSIFESVHRRKDGSTFPVEINVARFRLDRSYQVVIARDITERKRQEYALSHANRALRALSGGNSALAHAQNEEQLYAGITRSIVEMGGYRLAWVGLVEHDEDQSVRIVGHAGDGAVYLESARISWRPGSAPMDPPCRCVNSGSAEVVRDTTEDIADAPWRTKAVTCGFRSIAALPLKDGPAVFGVLVMYAADADAFDQDEMALLGELAGELSYGIRALRTRTQHEANLRQLGRSLEATVQALANTVELRDPYTAGHQRCVTELAVAIASELGLDSDRIQGLRLAANIHDIGKLSLPAEILSKPGKLTSTEYALIKTHAEAGRDIVKDIEFPWPIAEMIWQHHERCDGTGYPRGLSGDQILLEARIIAVADVVEAMASHRPYRAGKGMEAALDEITRSRGTTFDAGVIDACLTLFREKNFQLQVARLYGSRPG
ncbi:MAG: PAS domain S-box protein [Nevskia sp.]|nr:PAS domain S-box protein [Nevskia sp.]